MDNRNLYSTVATAVRVEHDTETGAIYLVFKVTDERLKREIISDWTKDIDLQVIGRDLMRFKKKNGDI